MNNSHIDKTTTRTYRCITLGICHLYHLTITSSIYGTGTLLYGKYNVNFGILTAVHKGLDYWSLQQNKE